MKVDKLLDKKDLDTTIMIIEFLICFNTVFKLRIFGIFGTGKINSYWNNPL